ncbi:MAG: alpha-galactosidase [Ruminococcus sp.]|nr:alpha-galactosidase [Ruminococcus sp.]
MRRYDISENRINMVIEIDDEKNVRLLHFSPLPFDESTISKRSGSFGFNLVEVQMSGLDRPFERHGNKYIITAPGCTLKYAGYTDVCNQLGRKIEVAQKDEATGVRVISHFQFFKGISAVRCWTVVTNNGSETQTLEYLSSFCLTGIEKEGLLPQDKKLRVGVCHNSWYRELQWKTYTLPELGLEQAMASEWQHSSKVFACTNVGNWSSKEYLPMGYVGNTETGTHMLWQIEHNGSWHWEISDREGHLYLQLSGPSEIESHWTKELAPNDTFVSVPCALSFSDVSFDEAVGEMTRYRRVIRRRNRDNKVLAVIFNDYMNCLWGDPTTEKEIPLIDAASKTGCDYFCIDAGWYADGQWWDEVGEWRESERRFPGGLKEVTDLIRARKMIPGVWLEIEVMGINCPLAKEKPDDWFFTRHGKRVYDRSRYQLDFRNPEVREYADSVIERLIKEYGVGYIKMDYNIEPGLGTEHDADSFGDGLLGHERAYLKWLDGVWQRHPDLIIENCSSGGMRIDYAMLSRYSIQSTSDQDDYRRYCTIAANAPLALTPEQAAVWSYPMCGRDREEVVFNMVNAMLLRIHQSGHLANIEPESRELVKQGIEVYKSIRQDIREAVPFWSLGLSSFSDSWVSLGLRNGRKNYLAVWRRESSEDTVKLPIKHLCGKAARVSCIYPDYNEEQFRWNASTGTLAVKLSKSYMARLFCIEELG